MKDVSVDLAEEFEREAMEALASATWDGPIAMVNFRKYRDRAFYPEDNHPPCTGREAYARFFETAAPALGDVGAEVVFSCDYVSDIIDLRSGDWDEIVIIQFPNRRAFLDAMEKTAELGDAMLHRYAGLSKFALLATRPK